MSSVLCINKQDLINKIAVERAMNYTEDLNIAYEILNGGAQVIQYLMVVQGHLLF